MKSYFAFVAVAAAWAAASLPMCAQGIGEMGGVYALPKGGPGDLHKTVNSLYNQGRFAPPQPGGGGGGGQRSGVIGLKSPAAHMSEEQIAAYTASAQRAYANALAASKAGKTDVALKEFGTALSVRERVWGSSDPAIADIARKQAALYSSTGRTAEAETAWRKVLASETRQFGAGSPKLCKTISTIASLCDSQGNNREALNLYRQLFAIQKKDSKPGTDSADVRRTRVKLAELLTFTGDFAGAESLLKEGLAAETSASSPNSAYQAQLYNCYGALLREQGRDADASTMETKAAALRGTSAAAEKLGSNPPADAPVPPTEAAPAATQTP